MQSIHSGVQSIVRSFNSYRMCLGHRALLVGQPVSMFFFFSKKKEFNDEH